MKMFEAEDHNIFELILMLILHSSKVSNLCLVIIAGVYCFSQHVA